MKNYMNAVVAHKEEIKQAFLMDLVKICVGFTAGTLAIYAVNLIR